MLPNYSLPSSQQRNFVVHWNGLYYIDHDAPFGATSAGGVFGRVADAKSAILKSKNIGPSKNWVVISFSLGSQFLYSPLQFFPILSQKFTLSDDSMSDFFICYFFLLFHYLA